MCCLLVPSNISEVSFYPAFPGEQQKEGGGALLLMEPHHISLLCLCVYKHVYMMLLVKLIMEDL